MKNCRIEASVVSRPSRSRIRRPISAKVNPSPSGESKRQAECDSGSERLLPRETAG
jgi:hypothetical protein